MFLGSELRFGGLLDSAIDEGFASFAADSGLGEADWGLAFETKILLLRIGQRVAASCVAAGPLRNDGLENLEGGCGQVEVCLLYTSPSPRDQRGSRMPSSA